jgi:hypothetical protein
MNSLLYLLSGTALLAFCDRFTCFLRHELRIKSFNISPDLSPLNFSENGQAIQQCRERRSKAVKQ